MVFYFSGTGNSKFIADRVAGAINEQAINITDCVQNSQFTFNLADGESLGIVVPVYYYGIPIIASEFLSNLKIQSGHDYYSYAIINCGGSTGDTARYVSRHIKLDAVYGIMTPGNYVPMFKMESDNIINEQLNAAEHDADKIAKLIKNRATGSYNKFTGRLPRLMSFFAYPMYEHGRKTKKFKVNDNCTGCGLCEKVCPRKIIDCAEHQKPVWTQRQCEICLACLHRCPVAAIDYGKSAGRGRYLNPRVEW